MRGSIIKSIIKGFNKSRGELRGPEGELGEKRQRRGGVRGRQGGVMEKFQHLKKFT